MLFIVSWSGAVEQRDGAYARFVKTGGTPPAGVKMLSRWHAVGRHAGFAVAEASDAVPLQKWALEWNDLITMDVYPALTDEQIGPLVAAAIGK